MSRPGLSPSQARLRAPWLAGDRPTFLGRPGNAPPRQRVAVHTLSHPARGDPRAVVSLPPARAHVSPCARAGRSLSSRGARASTRAPVVIPSLRAARPLPGGRCAVATKRRRALQEGAAARFAFALRQRRPARSPASAAARLGTRRVVSAPMVAPSSAAGRSVRPAALPDARLRGRRVLTAHRQTKQPAEPAAVFSFPPHDWGETEPNKTRVDTRCHPPKRSAFARLVPFDGPASSIEPAKQPAKRDRKSVV